MLRVRLREHIKFDIVRVAAQLLESILQIVDFILGQRQPQTEVGVNQRLTAEAQQVNAGDRSGLMVGEEFFTLFQRREDAFHHAVMQFGRHQRPLFVIQAARFDVIRHAAFQTHHLRQAAVMGDVGSFRRPGRDGAGTGGNEQ